MKKIGLIIIFILQGNKLRFEEVNCPKQPGIEHRFVWIISRNTALNPGSLE